MQTREQILIDRVSPYLPIKVNPEREILPRLREHFEDESINQKTVMEIHALFDMRNEGGLTCEIRPEGIEAEDLEKRFVCSITHFKIVRGEPQFERLEKYRLKRIRRLNRQ